MWNRNVALLSIGFGCVMAKFITSPSLPDGLVIVDRQGWHARPPTSVAPMANPVPFVVIHHSAVPTECTTQEECVEAMQSMQRFHQDTHGWADIGYSWAVGGDTRAYQGRGWSAVGAHAPTYNNISIGICIIGDWRDEIPPREQLDVVRKLIYYGVRLGMIHEDYKLVGHRQVRNGTECPGLSLFNEIKSWDHYVDYPDLVNNTYNPEKPTGNYLGLEQAEKEFARIRARLKDEVANVV